MTLNELAAETLVQKHTRLMQSKCRHNEIYCSTVAGPSGTFENRVCLDCGKYWHRAYGRPRKGEPYPRDEPAEVTIRKDRDEWPS